MRQRAAGTLPAAAACPVRRELVRQGLHLLAGFLSKEHTDTYVCVHFVKKPACQHFIWR